MNLRPVAFSHACSVQPLSHCHLTRDRADTSVDNSVHPVGKAQMCDLGEREDHVLSQKAGRLRLQVHVVKPGAFCVCVSLNTCSVHTLRVSQARTVGSDLVQDSFETVALCICIQLHKQSSCETFSGQRGDTTCHFAALDGGAAVPVSCVLVSQVVCLLLLASAARLFFV